VAVQCEPVPPPSALCCTIDRKLDDIVAKATARNVDERYVTAREMAKHLEAYLACGRSPVQASDVCGWLEEILPDSRPTLAALVEATRSSSYLRRDVSCRATDAGPDLATDVGGRGPVTTF